MSVARKYKMGGITEDPASLAAEYQEFLAKKIQENEGKFTSKALPLVQQQAAQWYEGATNGLFNYYERDPITSTYKIQADKLPEGLKGKVWEGSKDRINTNILGQFTANPDKSNKDEEFAEIKKFNSLVANWTNEFLNSKKTTPAQTISTSNKEVKLKSLHDYIYENKFNSSNEAFNEFANTIPDNVAMKQKLMDWGIEHVTGYVNDSKTNKDLKFEQVNPQILNQLITARQNNDWNSFVQAGSQLGWTFDNLLKQEQSEEEKAAKTKQENYSKSTSDLQNAGVTDEALLQQLLSNNFTIDTSGIVPGAPNWLGKWLTENKAILLRNDKSQYAIIKDNNYLDQIFEDPDDFTYGTYFKHDNGILNLKSHGMEGWDRSLFANPLGNSYGFRTLDGSVKGYEDWVIEGYPTNEGSGYSLNELGDVDYTKHLVLRKPGSNESIELFKNGENYIDKNGNTITGVNLNKFNGFKTMDLNGLLSTNDIFSSLKERDYSKSIKDTENFISEILNNRGTRRDDMPELQNIIRDLKFKIKNSPNITDREKALELYYMIVGDGKNYTGLSQEEQNRILNASPLNSWQKLKIFLATNPTFKKGGILKAQTGIRLADYAKSNISSENEPKKIHTPVKSQIGTFKDANALDWISLAGAAASFIPVAGVAGGAVMTAADLLNDITDGDGKIHWGNHAMNLGFTGLSAVGLGGLKGIQLANKSLRTLEKANELSNIINRARKVVNPETKELTKALNTIDKLGLNNFEKILEKVNKGKALKNTEIQALKDANLLKTNKLSPEKLKELKSKKIPIKGRETLNKELIAKTIASDLEEIKKVGTLNSVNESNYTKLVKNISTKKVPKYIKKGIAAGTVLSAVPSAIDITKEIASGTPEKIELNDIKSTLLPLNVGIKALREVKALKDYAKYTTVKKSNSSIKLKNSENDKIIELSEKVKMPKERTSMILPKKFKESYNKKQMDTFKAEIKKQNPKITDEELEEVVNNRKSLEYDITDSKEISRTLNPEPKGDQSKKAYNRAKKIFEGTFKYQMGGRMPVRRYPSLKPSIKYKSVYSGMSPYMLTPAPWENQVSTEWNPILYQAPKVNELNEDEWTSTEPSGYVPPSKQRNSKPTSDEELNKLQELLKLTEPEKETPLKLESWMPKWNKPKAIQFPVTTATNASTGNDMNAKNKGFKFGKLSFEDIGNSIMYLNTLLANSKSAKGQKRALNESIVNTPLLNHTYLRTSSPYSPLYDKQAAKLETTGKNIQESTSDLDKGIAARLSAGNQASTLREQGVQADLQNIQQGIEKQIGLNNQVDSSNLEIRSRNMLRNAEIMSKLHLVDANKAIANNTALNTYIGALHQTRQNAEMEKKYQDLYTAITDPEYKIALDNYSQLADQEIEAKKAWENNKADYSKTHHEGISQTWEESEEYKRLQELRKQRRKILDDYAYKINLVRTAANMPVPVNKKGGTLDEQEYLLKLRHIQQKELLERKEFFQQILKSNELLTKSLIKIFK